METSTLLIYNWFQVCRRHLATEMRVTLVCLALAVFAAAIQAVPLPQLEEKKGKVLKT